MTDIIEIKHSNALIKQHIQIKSPDGITYIDIDLTNVSINIRIEGRLFWLYTPDIVTVDDEVIPNITFRKLLSVLGYANNDITVIGVDSNSHWLDTLVYLSPLCQIVVQPIKALYVPFESGFTPFLDSYKKIEIEICV
jgi:hypothetical protein